MLQHFQDDDEEDNDEGLSTPSVITEGPFIVSKKPPLLKSMSQKSMIIPGQLFFYSPHLSNYNKVDIKNINVYVLRIAYVKIKLK